MSFSASQQYIYLLPSKSQWVATRMESTAVWSLSAEWRALAFTTTITVVTSVWCYVGRTWSFSTLALAMYLPGFLSFLFTPETFLNYLAQVLGVGRFQEAVAWSAVGAALAVAIVGSCLAMDLLLGWAHMTPPDFQKTQGRTSRTVFNFLAAGGEELGWRCFLLPTLTRVYSPLKAITLCGVAWGLFHVPVMVLLTRRQKIPRPLLTVTVQAIAVLLAAFPHGFVTIMSGYSVWSSTTMHFVWNTINPRLLGSIYLQTPGQVTGPQWLINGEGLMGCLVQGVAILCWLLCFGL